MFSIRSSPRMSRFFVLRAPSEETLLLLRGSCATLAICSVPTRHRCGHGRIEKRNSEYSLYPHTVRRLREPPPPPYVTASAHGRHRLHEASSPCSWCPADDTLHVPRTVIPAINKIPKTATGSSGWLTSHNLHARSFIFRKTIKPVIYNDQLHQNLICLCVCCVCVSVCVRAYVCACMCVC